MKYFMDTSALVKIYHKEAGTEKVLNIYKSTNNITISELSKVEFISNEAFHLLHKYAKTKALRSLDCIQLAFFEICCNSKDIFVCSDVKLIEVAKFEGYKILNPLI